MVFMLEVENKYYSFQSPLFYKSPVEYLDDSHMAKLVVHLVKLFEKENPELFKGKASGVPGPKFRYDKSEMLGLYVFATFRGHRSCRKIEAFLDDQSKACMYITNEKLPRKSKINQFKNEYVYLIEYFLKFTVKFGFNFGLVDVKTGLIIMQRIVKTDRYQLKPAIDYIIETYNVVPEYILADKGYYGLDQIEYTYSKGITPIIPDRNDTMKINGTWSDNPYAKCNMYFDPIKLEFTCLNNQKLKVDGIVEKDGELKLRFKTPECPNCPYKKECAKNSKYRILFEPFNPFFIERKKIFLSADGQLMYKFRAIHSEGTFSEIKEIQEFKKSKRRGRTKVEIDLILEAIVVNLKKIRTHLNVTLI